MNKKSKFSFILSIISIIISTAAILSYILLTTNDVVSWEWNSFISVAGLSLFVIITSIRDIIKYKKTE